MRGFTWLGTYAASFAVAMLAVSACPVVNPPTTLYRCHPGSADNPCPEFVNGAYLCCSDDPASLDLTDLDEPALPNYAKAIGHGIPLFAARRNDASHSGMCVRAETVHPNFALAEPAGCPIPCNPTWDEDDTEAVCGEGVFCCQTVEVDAADCVLDLDLGETGCWRPVRGTDATTWSDNSSGKRQDPQGLSCQAFVENLSTQTLETAGVERDEVLDACYRRLSVSDQRGFCIGGPAVAGCPLAQPSYRDPCEQQNDDEGRAGCE